MVYQKPPEAFYENNYYIYTHVLNQRSSLERIQKCVKINLSGGGEL
jgi:hypothetical protein